MVRLLGGSVVRKKLTVVHCLIVHFLLSHYALLSLSYRTSHKPHPASAFHCRVVRSVDRFTFSIQANDKTFYNRLLGHTRLGRGVRVSDVVEWEIKKDPSDF